MEEPVKHKTPVFYPYLWYNTRGQFVGFKAQATKHKAPARSWLRRLLGWHNA